jgi:hypothetical protein
MKRLKVNSIVLVVATVVIAIVFLIKLRTPRNPLADPSQLAALQSATLEHEASISDRLPSPEVQPTKPSQHRGWAGELDALRQLAAQNLDLALAQVRQLPTKEERDEALIAVCFVIGRTDPAKAMTTLWNTQKGTFENPDSGPAFENLARLWAAKDFSAAFAWANAQPNRENDERRDLVFKGIVSVLAQSSPQTAAQTVMNEIQPGRIQFQSAVLVLDHWMVSDSVKAQVWLEGLPKEGMREALFEHLANLDSSTETNPTRLTAGK